MSEEIDDGQPVVRYSAKELFAQINKKLDDLPALLEAKASQHDLNAVEVVVADHGKRIQTLEDRGLAIGRFYGGSLAFITAITGLGVLVFYLVHG